MKPTENPHFWLMDVDGELMTRSRIWLAHDYKKSDFHSIDLWNPNSADHPVSGKLRYLMKGGDIGRLASYDFYPAPAGVPVVSERMMHVVREICSPNEVGFRECEISNSRGQTIEAWNMFPLHEAWCIDAIKSRVTWYVPNLKPDEVSVEWASKIVFRPDCLGDRNMVRVRESASWIIVSDRLKQAIEALNPKGIEFTHDSDNRIGNPMRSTDPKFHTED